MDLNIKQMKELIDLFEDSNLSEMSVQQDEFQVTLKKDSRGETKTGSSAARAQEAGKAKVEKEDAERTGGEPESFSEETETRDGAAITSPIVGTFYRSASPEEPPYVDVGDEVKKGDTVCIVEAMKVMNEVKAEQNGEVTEICVEDGDSVEYGQELFKLSPPAKGS